MSTTTHFANMLLSSDFPMGRMHAPKRRKGDWFHSIAVFCDRSIANLPVGGEWVYAEVIHFCGSNGSPKLLTTQTSIKCVKKHMGKKLYTLNVWDDSFAVIGDVRTVDGYKDGFGSCDLPMSKIYAAATDKWGDNKIPYAHQRSEAYNCVAFVDDILHLCTTGVWSPRIVAAHELHGLYI